MHANFSHFRENRYDVWIPKSFYQVGAVLRQKTSFSFFAKDSSSFAQPHCEGNLTAIYIIYINLRKPVKKENRLKARHRRLGIFFCVEDFSNFALYQRCWWHTSVTQRAWDALISFRRICALTAGLSMFMKVVCLCLCTTCKGMSCSLFSEAPAS